MITLTANEILENKCLCSCILQVQKSTIKIKKVLLLALPSLLLFLPKFAPGTPPLDLPLLGHSLHASVVKIHTSKNTSDRSQFVILIFLRCYSNSHDIALGLVNGNIHRTYSLFEAEGRFLSFLRLFCRMRNRSLVSEREFTRLVVRSILGS